MVVEIIITPLLLLRYEDLADPANYANQLVRVHSFMYKSQPYRGAELGAAAGAGQGSREEEEGRLSEYLRRSKEFQTGETLGS